MRNEIPSSLGIQQRAQTEINITSLQDRAKKAYKEYQRNTSFFERILAHFHPDHHSTVRWVCVCLKHANEFNDQGILQFLKKEHKSLRLALEQINQDVGCTDNISKLPSKEEAIKFAINNSIEGAVKCLTSDPVDVESFELGCRFDPRKGFFGTFIFNLGEHQVAVPTNKATKRPFPWNTNVIFNAFKPLIPFYSIMNDLANLGKLKQPIIPDVRNTLKTTLLNGYLTDKNPLITATDEIELNRQIKIYNTTLEKAQKAVKEAFGNNASSYLNTVSAAVMTSAPVLEILKAMDQKTHDNYITFNNNDKTSHLVNVGVGAMMVNKRQLEYPRHKYTLLRAGLNVQLPASDTLINNIKQLSRKNSADTIDQCTNLYMKEYRLALKAIVHYEDQLEKITKIIANPIYVGIAPTLGNRKKQVEECLNSARIQFNDMKKMVGIPADCNETDSEMEEKYRNYGHRIIIALAESDKRPGRSPITRSENNSPSLQMQTLYPLTATQQVDGAKILQLIEERYSDSVETVPERTQSVPLSSTTINMSIPPLAATSPL